MIAFRIEPKEGHTKKKFLRLRSHRAANKMKVKTSQLRKVPDSPACDTTASSDVSCDRICSVGGEPVEDSSISSKHNKSSSTILFFLVLAFDSEGPNNCEKPRNSAAADDARLTCSTSVDDDGGGDGDARRVADASYPTAKVVSNSAGGAGGGAL